MDLLWTSSNPDFATVDDQGMVTTKRPGDVEITVTSEKGIRRKCIVHICYPVSAIEIMPDDVEIQVGMTFQLTANVTMRTQSCVNHLVFFISNNPDVADVNEHGLVEGKANGIAIITVSGIINSTATATVQIRVGVCGEIDGAYVNHIWGEPAYEWAADNSKVTATRVCARDASHIETETVNAISEVTKVATCEGKGETTYTSVAFNNTAFTVQTKTVENIPALTHAWGTPAYEWAADNSSVTATRICAHDASHIETETVSTATEVTKEATCEVNGETTYTATFTNSAFAEQTKTLDNIPALTHSWGTPAYEWAADNSKVTAIRVCARDASHVETEEAATTSEVTKAATCEGKGETTYTSAAFENMAFTAQTKTVDDIPALTHDWGEPTYEWNTENKVTATRVCRNDSEHAESETVDVIVTITSPTNAAAGLLSYVAQFGNPAFTKQEKSIEIPALKDMNVMYLPTELKTIEKEAFSGIIAQAVIVPDGCTTINARAFADCPNLLYVWIPKSVTSISEHAFDGCNEVIVDYEK